MSDDITIRGRLDTSQMEEQEAAWRVRLRRLNRDIQQTKTELRRTQLYAVGVLGSIMSIANTMVAFLPEPFRIIGQAAVNVVTATIQALSAAALAYASGGPVFWLQAAMAAVGVGIAVLSLGATISNQQQLDSDVLKLTNAFRNISNSLTGIMQSLGR